MGLAATESDLLREILSISRLLVVTTDLDALLTRIAHAACKIIECDRATIYLHDAKTHELWSRVAIGADEIRFPADLGIAGHVFTANKLLHVSDPYADPRFNPDPDRRSGFITRNLLTVPLVDIDRKPLGVLQAVNTTDEDFSESDQQMIQMLADQAGVAIQRYHLQQTAIEAAELKRELQLARDVQLALLPEAPPEIAGIECIGWSRPAGITGGDIYDLWQMRDGSLGIFVGDAMGHGLAPTLMVSQVRTVLRSLCDIESDPMKLLRLLNERFADDFASGKFATTFFGTLRGDGLLKWSSAGHGPSIVCPDLAQPPELIEANGIPLGILDHDYTAINVHPISLQPGGWLAIISDGIHEALNANGQYFGIDRTLELLLPLSTDSLCTVLSRLQAAVTEWQGVELPQDDQTVVFIRRSKDPRSTP